MNCLLLTEVEMVINSRPLSYVSTDDQEEPLTPSHLLVGRRLMNLPDHISARDQTDEEVEVDSNLLTRRAQHLNKTLTHFWSGWRNEYLLELRESHHHHNTGNPKATPVLVGDIVVVHHKTLPREFWRLGKVDDVVTGRDGYVRGAKVKVAKKETGSVMLYWPIQRLFPHEVNCGTRQVRVNSPVNNLPLTTDGDEVIGDEDAGLVIQRPRRAAAWETRDKIMAYALSEN